jgi:hypothetical protein
MEILKKTLDEMPIEFNSNQFADKAKRNGLSQYQINSGLMLSFLHNNCKQGMTRRQWSKKNTDTIQLSEAIKIVKSNGYKVMKQQIEWIEL